MFHRLTRAGYHWCWSTLFLGRKYLPSLFQWPLKRPIGSNRVTYLLETMESEPRRTFRSIVSLWCIILKDRKLKKRFFSLQLEMEESWWIQTVASRPLQESALNSDRSLLVGAPGLRLCEADYQASLCCRQLSEDYLRHSSFRWVMCSHIIPNSVWQNYICG